MELTLQEVEDLAIGRLVRNNIDLLPDIPSNLALAISVQLLANEIPTVELERKYVDQSIASQIGEKSMQLVGVAA